MRARHLAKKTRVVLLQRARALVLPCAYLCAVKFVTERGQRQCGWGGRAVVFLFPSLRTVRIGVASDGRAAQSRSCGSIRTLCRTTVPRLKFTRTAGKRRPFIDCSSSRSEPPPSRKRSDDQSRKISWVIAQLSERLKQLCMTRKPSDR